MNTLFLLLSGFTIGLFAGIALIYVLMHWSKTLEAEHLEMGSPMKDIDDVSS